MAQRQPFIGAAKGSGVNIQATFARPGHGFETSTNLAWTQPVSRRQARQSQPYGSSWRQQR